MIYQRSSAAWEMVANQVRQRYTLRVVRKPLGPPSNSVTFDDQLRPGGNPGQTTRIGRPMVAAAADSVPKSRSRSHRRKKPLRIVGQMRKEPEIHSPTQLRHFCLWGQLPCLLRASWRQRNHTRMRTTEVQRLTGKQKGNNGTSDGPSIRRRYP